jgi:hypothetical protein
LLVLSRCGEAIEAQLLSQVQFWLADSDELIDLMSENGEAVLKRNRRRELKLKIDSALEKLSDLTIVIS